MFNTEVSALQFNVLVTTYEYIMRDRARLSKVRIEGTVSCSPDRLTIAAKTEIVSLGIVLDAEALKFGCIERGSVGITVGWKCSTAAFEPTRPSPVEQE